MMWPLKRSPGGASANSASRRALRSSSGSRIKSSPSRCSRSNAKYTNAAGASPFPGSLTQRYAKRHAKVRECLEICRFHRVSSPHFALRFQGDFWGENIRWRSGASRPAWPRRPVDRRDRGRGAQARRQVVAVAGAAGVAGESAHARSPGVSADGRPRASRLFPADHRGDGKTNN